MVLVTLKMPEEMVREIDRIANQLGMSRSQVIRYAVKQLITGEEPKPPTIRVRKVTIPDDRTAPPPVKSWVPPPRTCRKIAELLERVKRKL